MSLHSDDRDGVCRTNGSREEAAPVPRDFVAARSLKRQLLAELRTSWEEGQPIRPEDLLSRWPANVQADPDVASLLIEDYCQRRLQGQQPTSEEYGCRFPGQKGSFAGLLGHESLVRSCGGTATGGSPMLALPVAGDELFGFRLCHEIGRGSYARVFLAEQKVLAARPVVVKVSAIDGDEPQTLAQLQHTYIVPIYSVHEDGRAGLRVVCMPYFGGASLSRVLQALWAETHLPTRGKQLVAALSAVRSPWSPADDAAPPAARGPLPLLARLSYVSAAAWIVARLAEALQHAHQRGVLHRDVKPSNILLGADGQPMLLDFNLAENLRAENAQAVATVGGTVAYMAPEHLRALATRDPALARQVDHRADLYGLGMVFYEMLTGRGPFGQSASYSPIPALVEAMAVERTAFAPSVRQHRPDVPWGLESITRKCLDPDPARRYQQAEHLVEDLRRFLEDRPLRYAPERSWRERLVKWRRRHPRLAVSGVSAVAAALLLTASTALLISARTQRDAAERRAEEAARDVALQRQHVFVNRAQEARCLLNTTAGPHDFLEEGIEVCLAALGSYEVLTREDWQEQPVWQKLEPKEQRQRADDVRELLLLLARARIQRAPAEADPELPSTLAATLAPLGPPVSPVSSLSPWAAGQSVWVPKAKRLQGAIHAALEKSLELLKRAEAIGGKEGARAIWKDRTVYLERLGRLEEARAARQKATEILPASARDHYLLAIAQTHNGRHIEAIHELKQALQLNSQDYWSYFQLGICYRLLGDNVQAASAFRACIALWPEFSWGYFNCGAVLYSLGKKREAIEEYSAALRRKPDITLSYFNRGLIYLDLCQWQQALEDFDDALAEGWESAALHCSRGFALERLGRFAEADAAFERTRHFPEDPDILVGYAFAVCERLRDRAWETFHKVLERDRKNPRALYGCGMLLAREARDSKEALDSFSEAFQQDPSLIPALLGHANVLAHRGQWDMALQEVDFCVKADPAGPTLYAAACVYALTAEKGPRSAAGLRAERALDYLDEAFKQGIGPEKAAHDSDLDGIRQHPKFRLLLRQAAKPKDPV